MARWRKHNRRADKKRLMSYARFRRLRKAARLGYLYGMGARKLAEYCGTVTGRIVWPGPGALDRLPKTVPAILPQGEAVIPDYAALELRALALHQRQLQEARARGDTVIEHNAYDATVIARGETQ